MFQYPASIAAVTRIATACLATLLAVASVSPACADDRPDIVIIMTDDLGYSDLGAYGGEIDTPHLDQLAKDGAMFTRFRVAPMCVVSRVAMVAGLPMQGGGDARYSRTVPLFSVLKEAGYNTLMTGKWHAGQPDPRSPELFDRFFGFLGGMSDCYSGGPDWYLNDKPFTDFGGDFYATNAFTDYAIEFLREHEDDGRPDLLFLSYNAPHHPCQAPQRTVSKYVNRYRAGYDAIREARLDRQRELGLIDDSFVPADHHAEVRRWSELPTERKKVEADRMAAYAAMVDEVDQNIGRLLDYLRDSGRLDNTILLFISDNGGDYSNGNPRTDARQIPWEAGGNPSSSNGWAWVKNTPFRSFKHSSYEGALASPLIIHWPEALADHPAVRGGLIDEPTHITDFYPTLLEVAGAQRPQQHGGKQLLPLSGASLMPLLRDSADERENKPAFSWYRESRAWIEDEWKAVQLYGGPWQLFNLREDRGETRDLAADYPDRLDDAVAKWHAQADPGTVYSHPPAQDVQHGWGWHRVARITQGQLRSLWPANGSTNAPVATPLTLRFTAPLDFTGSKGRTLRVYADRNEGTPVYEIDVTPNHPAQGQTELVLLDLPTLRPDTGYHVVWDPGWAKVGGKPLGPLNNGAYWWRFRTAKD